MDEKREQPKNNHKKHTHHSGTGTFYGLGFVGALVYYVQGSSTVVEFLFAVLKAIVWPALLIHKVFNVLGM